MALYQQKQESFVYWSEHEPLVPWNWFAVLSYAASVAFSVAFWAGLIRGVAYLVR